MANHCVRAHRLEGPAGRASEHEIGELAIWPRDAMHQHASVQCTEATGQIEKRETFGWFEPKRNAADAKHGNQSIVCSGLASNLGLQSEPGQLAVSRCQACRGYPVAQISTLWKAVGIEVGETGELLNVRTGLDQVDGPRNAGERSRCNPSARREYLFHHIVLEVAALRPRVLEGRPRRTVGAIDELTNREAGKERLNTRLTHDFEA